MWTSSARRRAGAVAWLMALSWSGCADAPASDRGAGRGAVDVGLDVAEDINSRQDVVEVGRDAQDTDAGASLPLCPAPLHCGRWGESLACLDHNNGPPREKPLCGGVEELRCPDGFQCFGDSSVGYCLLECAGTNLCPQDQGRRECGSLSTCVGTDCHSTDGGVCLPDVHPPPDAELCKIDSDCGLDEYGCYVLYPPRHMAPDHTGFCLQLCEEN